MDVIQFVSQWGGLIVLVGAIGGTVWKVLYPVVRLKKSFDKRISDS